MPDQISSNGPDGPRNPFTNKWFIASGTFLGCVALLGSWIALDGKDEQTTADGTAAPVTSAPTSTPGGGAGSPGGASTASPSASAPCPQLPDNNQAPLTISNTFAKKELTWKDFHGYRLPESPSSGPAVHSGDVARCYAHSPRGAVLALAQTSIRSSNADNWRAAIDQLVAPGPERDSYLQFVTAARVNPSQPTPGSATIGEYAAYQVNSYTNDTAVVTFAIEFPIGGAYRTVVLTAVWDGTDWKQKMTPLGQQSSAVGQQQTITTMVPFGVGN
ncbi:hypothetical protein PUR71_07100 [Streptomyces sp. SP17BM10]|uniref:hypothetical protein n=1 Tax=Streptomyces sp. SP17BM10 TaxID=3002530 RepID=UPI002E799004|nr:hypothetical protein [Streptomyces sp. SP17BM10]MEE1782689.1 hypothetical protein [Streptomyces sp. SP17BM10]